jgi:hypothetical protein
MARPTCLSAWKREHRTAITQAVLSWAFKVSRFIPDHICVFYLSCRQ